MMSVVQKWRKYAERLCDVETHLCGRPVLNAGAGKCSALESVCAVAQSQSQSKAEVLESGAHSASLMPTFLPCLPAL